MKLRPCWFINAEVRNLVFNDVEWLNLDIDIDRSGLTKEFKALRKRNVRRIRQTLIKTFNQLGDNAEANRRIEEARLHRKQSIALNKYQCHIHEETDKGKKDNIRRNVCKKYPVVNEDGGNYYCLWHNPPSINPKYSCANSRNGRRRGIPIFVPSFFPLPSNTRAMFPAI